MKINAINEVNNIAFQKRKQQEEMQKEEGQPKNIGLPIFNLKLFTPKYQRQYKKLCEGMITNAVEMEKLAEQYARKYVIYKDNKSKIATITNNHYYIAFLDTILEYARKVQNGEINYEKEATRATEFIADCTSEWVWTEKNISKTVKVIEEEYKAVQKELEEKSSKNAFVSTVYVDEDLMKDFDDLARSFLAGADTNDISSITPNEVFFVSAILNSSRPSGLSYRTKIKDFFHNLSMSATTNEIDDTVPPMPFYKDLAKRAIKNADKNYNMFITYSSNDEKAPLYFISGLNEALKDTDDTELKNIKNGKTKLIVFNKRSNLDTIATECKKLKNDPDTQYFIVINNIMKVSSNTLIHDDNGIPFIQNGVLENSLSNDSKNIHFIVIDNQDNYYTLTQTENRFEQVMRDYQNQQLPLLDANSLSQQVLATKEYIKSQFDTDIDDEALAYISSLPINSKGSGYDNVIRFIKNIASYYVDDEIITKDMAQSYWESTQKEDLSTTDSTYDIVFDTKKNLDNIIGTPMVKKQAQKVVYELENFPKTKGYILYKSGAQSGRLNCAKAIAGELKIPMICINAADFAMRDLDTVTNDPMKAIEVKMSKLLNTMRTQAQTNPRKMVMLYISNFDNFGSNPIYGISSIYEQQAFQKLLREMQKTYNDGGYNIVVMGASDYPEVTNEDIMRPGMFMDSIAIYPPESIDNIKEIAQKHIQDKGYKLEDENKTLNHFLKLMQISQADYIDNTFLLDKAYISAYKRGSDTISIADINEAYLSNIAGEVASRDSMLKPVHKEAIIRHEGGHAVNLQFMYNLFKEKNDVMRIGDSIVNVVLDPRSWYGGCVYPMRSWDNMGEMNMETVMSDIICSFGGNSAEEHFYDMDGSWGISQDRKNANDMARIAVLDMGLGARMKHYIPDTDPNTGYPILSASDEEDYVEDVKTILENAKIASDKIVKCYEDFLIEFSNKYESKYGTGECIVTGDEFSDMLKTWEEKQTPKKKQEIARLKKEILAIIEYTKKGIVYQGINKINPIYRMF